MIDSPQPLAKLTGAEGCYAIVGVGIAEDASGRPIPILESIAHGMRMNWINATCTVTNMAAFVSDLTGEEWEVIKAGPGHPLPINYQLQPGEYEALRFERYQLNAQGQRVLDANGQPVLEPLFVRGSGDGITVKSDPWPGSLTVRVGWLVSRRIFRRRKK
jgi:hypothetical protein